MCNGHYMDYLCVMACPERVYGTGNRRGTHEH